jgi:hypothetical protein
LLLYRVVPFFASRPATSFPCMSTWEGTHCTHVFQTFPVLLLKCLLV